MDSDLLGLHRAHQANEAEMRDGYAARVLSVFDSHPQGPDAPMRLDLVWQSYFEDGLYLQAESLLRERVHVPYAQRALAMLLVREHRDLVALPELERALALAPDRVLLNEAAGIHHRSGRREQAKRYVDLARTAKMPNYPIFTDPVIIEPATSLDAARVREDITPFVEAALQNPTGLNEIEVERALDRFWPSASARGFHFRGLLINVHMQRRQFNKADAIGRRVLAAMTRVQPEDSPLRMAVIHMLGHVDAARGNQAGVLARTHEELILAEKIYGPVHSALRDVLSRYGALLREANRNAEAEAQFARVAEITSVVEGT